MALKPDRSIVGNQTDISYFYNSTAEKGEILVFSTAGSGAAMDDANAVLTRPSASPSGQIFAGILLNDVVNKDLTQTHINLEKDEVQQGGKVTLLVSGPAMIVTNIIESGQSPTIGQPLYFRLANTSADAVKRGVLSTTAVVDSGAGDANVRIAQARSNLHNYQVGRALSVVDADRYLKVEVKQFS
uniref:Putative structural protein n=1 Tax=viral metagenome TaxID=1070528 RepID=A0A6M3K436_9ZZZZ